MLIQHSVLYFISRALPGSINLLALAVYTHLLSPDEYGRYALVIYSIGLANTLLYWWLRLGLIRFAPRYMDDQTFFLASLLRGYALASGLSMLIAIGSILFFKDAQLQILIIFSTLLLWVSAWFDLNLELIRSRLSPVYFGMLSLIRATLALLVGGGLAWAGFSMWGLLIGAFVAVLLPGLWEIQKSWRGVDIKRIDYGILRELLVYGLPLIGVFGMEYVVSSSDRFMLGWLIDPAATGSYSAAYDLTNQSLTLIMSVVYLGGYPLIVKALETEAGQVVKQMLSKYLGIILALGLPATVIAFFLANGISGSLLGSQFHEDAVRLMPWVAIATLFACMKSYYFDIAFQLSRRTSRQLLVIAIPAVLNIVLNLWWIPIFGVMGAAYATLAAYVMAAVMSWWLGRREHEMPIINRDVIQTILSAGVMILVAIVMRDHYDQSGLIRWMTMGVVLFMVYGSLMLALNACGLRSWLKYKFKYRGA